MVELTGKVAMITGAASGIGLATARQFARAGARLALVDLNRDGLAEAHRELHHSLLLPIDVADAGAVSAAVDQVVDQFGQIDVLVNHAAVVDNWGLPADVPEHVWTEILGVNLCGIVNTCRSVIPRMGRGAIVNTSSICGAGRPCISRAPYNAAKAGVVAFTKDLAVAYGPRGIRANVLVPGFVDTPMSRRLVVGHEGKAKEEEGRIPLRRLGSSEELANATLFLASDYASYITGAVLFADGGLSLV